MEADGGRKDGNAMGGMRDFERGDELWFEVRIPDGEGRAIWNCRMRKPGRLVCLLDEVSEGVQFIVGYREEDTAWRVWKHKPTAREQMARAWREADDSAD